MCRFVMASKDAASGTLRAPLNPLKLTSPEEKHLFKSGEGNIALRAKKHEDSLIKQPPNQDENEIMHKMFLKTLNNEARCFKAREKPTENSEWMTDPGAKLKSVLLCEPKHRNYYNLVFGGLIMEKCMDLALTLAYSYTGCNAAPVCTHVDDVNFNMPVEIGDLLYLHSQVCSAKVIKLSSQSLSPPSQQPPSPHQDCKVPKPNSLDWG